MPLNAVGFSRMFGKLCRRVCWGGTCRALGAGTHRTNSSNDAELGARVCTPHALGRPMRSIHGGHA